MATALVAACGAAAGDVALDALRRYRDFVTRVVCCYGVETESEAGDEALELIELLPAEGGNGGSRSAAARSRGPMRGRASSGGELRGAAALSRGGGSDASDEYCDTSSDDEDEDEESRGGAMMRPAAPPRRDAADADDRSPAQRIVQRLHERPQRRSRALARALTDAASPASGAGAQATLGGGDAQTLMVPLYAPGASE